MLTKLLAKAKKAKIDMQALSAVQRDTALEMMAQGILLSKNEILQANKLDVASGKKHLSQAMLDRLRLDEQRIEAMAQGILAVQSLESPLGAIELEKRHPQGMLIQKVRVPIGVVAIIYESRPNVTADAAALCLKSGNVCVLRGGKDAIHTNKAVAGVLRKALKDAGVPENAVQLVEDTTHDSARALMEARGYVDLLIPRGGKGLIQAVVEGAKGVPVIETGTGICHIYVDKSANLDMAATILYNAKISRPSVCNAVEVCLVHQDIAEIFLPLLQKTLQNKVELRLDSQAAQSIAGIPAGPDDFDTEFLDYVLAIGVVADIQQAIRHIAAHSTGHSDGIISEDPNAQALFCQQVDSAAVYVNASTRFTDGGEFGLGCEMGISTQKIGARGPMGLYELTSYKYIVQGEGQIR